jgi:hypothetical protein
MASKPSVTIDADGTVTAAVFYDCLIRSFTDGRRCVVVLRYLRGPAHKARVEAGEEDPDTLQVIVRIEDLLDLANLMIEAARKAGFNDTPPPTMKN